MCRRTHLLRRCASRGFFSGTRITVLAATFLAAAATDTFPIDPATPQRLAADKDVQPLLAGYVDPTLAPYNAGSTTVIRAVYASSMAA